MRGRVSFNNTSYEGTGCKTVIVQGKSLMRQNSGEIHVLPECTLLSFCCILIVLQAWSCISDPAAGDNISHIHTFIQPQEFIAAAWCIILGPTAFLRNLFDLELRCRKWIVTWTNIFRMYVCLWFMWSGWHGAAWSYVTGDNVTKIFTNNAALGVSPPLNMAMHIVITIFTQKYFISMRIAQIEPIQLKFLNDSWIIQGFWYVKKSALSECPVSS